MTRINQIVSNWNLEDNEIVEKIKVLESWEAILEKDVFENILAICDNFFYYSSKEVGENFVESYNQLLNYNENSSGLNFLSFGEGDENPLEYYKSNETKFIPLRTEERMESSNPIFVNFQKENRIPIGYTSLDRIEFLLSKIRDFQKTYEELEEEFELAKETTEKERKLELLTQFCSKNQDIFRLNNIFIIDDFIGSGSSLRCFLENIKEFFPLFQVVNFYFYVLEVSPLAIDELSIYAKENNINFIVIYNKISKDILKETFKTPHYVIVENQLDELNTKYKISRSKYCINNAIASYVSTPNNNIPFLYFENDSWSPLFKRENKFGPPGMKKNDVKECILNKRRKKMRS